MEHALISVLWKLCKTKHYKLRCFVNQNFIKFDFRSSLKQIHRYANPICMNSGLCLAWGSKPQCVSWSVMTFLFCVKWD